MLQFKKVKNISIYQNRRYYEHDDWKSFNFDHEYASIISNVLKKNRSAIKCINITDAGQLKNGSHFFEPIPVHRVLDKILSVIGSVNFSKLEQFRMGMHCLDSNSFYRFALQKEQQFENVIKCISSINKRRYGDSGEWRPTHCGAFFVARQTLAAHLKNNKLEWFVQALHKMYQNRS